METQGFVLTVNVHHVGGMDCDGVTLGLPPAQKKAQCPRLTHVWLEAGDDVEPALCTAFTVLPRRGAVERTCAWWGQSRRLSKEYERLWASSEAMIYAAMSRLMVRRLAAA
jgi:transposase